MTDTIAEDRPLALADVPLARDLVPTDRKLLPAPMAVLEEGADLIQAAGAFVNKGVRDDRGACVALSYIAALHGTDLIATASKAYMTNQRLAFEAQYVNALVQRHLTDRPVYTYQGEGSSRAVMVTATPKGSSQKLEYRSPQVGQIKVKNSPLWTSDPDQQLGYYAIRMWARRHMPDVLLGIYAVEELQQVTIRDVTPTPDLFAVEDDLDSLEEVEAEEVIPGEAQTFEPSGGFTPVTDTAGPTDSAAAQQPVADDVLEWGIICAQDAGKAEDEAALARLWDENEGNRRKLYRQDRSAHDDLERAFIERQKELRATSA